MKKSKTYRDKMEVFLIWGLASARFSPSRYKTVKSFKNKYWSVVDGITYSYLKASTGFLFAAFHDCAVTVKRAINKAINPARAKIHQPNAIL